MKPRATIVLLLALLLLSGCLEQLSTTRVPAGAARNFFHYLTTGRAQDAAAYWAPDSIPAGGDESIREAIALLAAYDFRQLKAETEQRDMGAVVLLRGEVRPGGGSEWSPPQELMRAELIERGPGWRLTSFEILCCAAAAGEATPTSIPR